ncbi:MAG: acyltransferase [Gammaproteobacteria bacterium]|nr:acyltransferase [Gammaproteobacteria bacterium]
MKIAVVSVAHGFTWPVALPAVLGQRVFHSERAFDFSAKLLSLMPGRLGQYLRASFYMLTLDECHYDLAVGFGSFFAHPTARVGRGVGIGCFSIIGSAELADGVMVGSRASILSGKYHHGGGNRHRDVRENPLLLETVRIGEATWIAEGALVMANVGAHCIVAAGSVVTKAIPDGATAVGNPARCVHYGERTEAAVV